MERPKSAKYNIERVKKSSTYLNTSARRQVSNLSNDSSGMDNITTGGRPVPAQRTSILNGGGGTGDPLPPPPLPQQYQQQQQFDRLHQSKSAYIPRPQSARHNLDKYRQDVLVERQRKLNIVGGDRLIDGGDKPARDVSAHLVVSQTTVDPAAMFDLLMDEDDMDKLDTLLIREDADSSSSDVESNHSSFSNNTNPGNVNNSNGPQKMKLKPVTDNNNNNNNNNSNNHNRNKKHNNGVNNNDPANKKSKLLAKRSTPGSGGDSNSSSSQQLPNKSVLLNQYTTFRPTAVTTNYSSSPLGISGVVPANNCSHQTTVITLHPVNGNADMSGLNDTLIGSEHNSASNGGGNGIVPQNINSSSSSTSTSSSSKKHLLTASADSSSNGGSSGNGNANNISGINNASSVKRDQLLKEWLKHDDEVELEIMTIQPTSQGAVVVVPASTNNSRQQMNNSKNYNYQQQQQTNSRLANNNRAGSRFSDYSSNSNVPASNFINPNNNNMNSFQAKERTNLIDPWTKRNPTLVAQNVLLKHRAELEQLAASRTTNNTSQVSNASTTVGNGVMYHGGGGGGHHHHHANANKYLLPDNKYYKK